MRKVIIDCCNDWWSLCFKVIFFLNYDGTSLLCANYLVCLASGGMDYALLQQWMMATRLYSKCVDVGLPCVNCFAYYTQGEFTNHLLVEAYVVRYKLEQHHVSSITDTITGFPTQITRYKQTRLLLEALQPQNFIESST